MRDTESQLFGGGAENLRLANPISADLDVMRPSILPNLLAAVGRNTDRGMGDAALFEVGAIWQSDASDGQHTVATGVRAGLSGPRHWSAPPCAADVFDSKADALAVLAACGGPVDKAQATPDAPDWYHPGRSGALRLGKNVLAWFGEIHPRILDALDVRGPIAAFEIFLEAIPVPKASASKSRALLKVSAFQPVNRDFAFVVDENVPASKLIGAVRAADKNLVTNVGVFDVFTGATIGVDKKSVALSVTLQPVQATMTDAEIDEVAARIVANVEKQTGGVLRG